MVKNGIIVNRIARGGTVQEGLVSGANKKLVPGTVILTLHAWCKLEHIFEQVKVKYVKYKIWQDE